MEATSTNSDTMAAGDLHSTKRTASEDPEGAPATKRVGSSEAPSTSSNDAELKPTFRVPLFEKVRRGHTNKGTC